MATNETLVNIVSVDQLAAVLKHRTEKALIIDSRSFLEFNTCHIVNAVNVCCSKLVKRRLQHDKVSIKDFLMSTCQVAVEDKFDIIVYDQSSKDFHSISPDSFIFVLLQKLVSVFNSVNILEGGFLKFHSKYLSLCEDKTRKCVPLVSLSQPCLPISNTGPTRILPFLYLGSQHDAMNKELLHDHNITYELNVSTSCPKPDFISDRHFLRIPVNDNYSEKLLLHFPMAFQFVDKVREANGCVLVHCLAGISRSPTVAIAYIMRYLHMSSDEAYRYVKSKRATISPNFNFLGQLLEYENQLRNENVLQRFKETKDSLCSPGQGNKRHCHTMIQKNEIKLSVTHEHTSKSFGSGFTSKGDRSPTAALANLSFTSSIKDADLSKTMRLETVAEESKFNALAKKSNIGQGVHKSQSTSNIWTLNSSLWLNERRSSYDASASELMQNTKKPSKNFLQKQTIDESQKRISFEGLKGIPFSLLDHINFMPCQASLRASQEVQQTSNNCLILDPPNNSTSSFGASLEFHRSHITQSNLGQSSWKPASDLTFSDTTSDLNELCVAGETYIPTRESSSSREMSPRPAGLLVAPFGSATAKHDLIEDEGIELIRDECDIEDVPKLQNPSLGSRPFSFAKMSETTRVELKAGQAENLESSYDSGVFPSPTQYEFNEVIQSCKKTGPWTTDVKECKTFRPLCETHQSVSSNTEQIYSQGTILDLDNSNAASKSYSKLATNVGSLGLESRTIVSISKRCSFPDCRGSDRLYRTHSCPGIFGWLHCSSQSFDSLNTSTDMPKTPRRQLKTSPFDRAMWPRNRYSCGSLDLWESEERDSVTFDSCPDFGHYCKRLNETKHKHGDVSSLSPTCHRSFIRRTSIIQVS